MTTDTNSTEEKLKVPSVRRRILEGVAMAFPVVAALILLMVSGISLWMARILPEEITTAFMGGVFLGILITEGTLQIFGRLFLFYYEQGNISEAKRVLRRNYLFLFMFSAVSIGLVVGIASLASIPMTLVGITVVSMVSIALHRSSYLLIYSLKKVMPVILAYSAALAALVLMFTLLTPYFPNATMRYFASLGVAFEVLLIPALYFHVKLWKTKSTKTAKLDAPHFYSPPSVGRTNVKSRLGIQLWETLPNFIFGTFSFLMVFGDRIISWIFNPAVQTYGFVLPLEFNAVYHDGADPALAVLMVTTLIAYVLTSPIYEQLTNITSRISISEVRDVEDFLMRSYDKVLLVSIVISSSLVAVLNYLAPSIMSYLGASSTSLEIFRVAAVSDVFLAIFIINAMFMNLINKMNLAALISVFCASIIVIGGIFLGRYGFQDIIYAYLASSVISMAISTLYFKSQSGKLSRTFFARFV
ncbi:MAG: hypothetical protein JRN15_04390 [Nitrososphaerota archaeon]|nr:hypothetical protein [Nitrososphaerota archaeon]